jgi:hypothetical protein
MPNGKDLRQDRQEDLSRACVSNVNTMSAQVRLFGWKGSRTRSSYSASGDAAVCKWDACGIASGVWQCQRLQ